jgi:competence protein ComEA
MTRFTNPDFAKPRSACPPAAAVLPGRTEASGVHPLRGLRALLGAALVACSSLLPFAALADEPAAAMESPSAAAAPMAAVNINTASADELAAALAGVGASRADAIVRYRELYGPFESIEELAEVSGIGAATVERNRAVITLN